MILRKLRQLISSYRFRAWHAYLFLALAPFLLYFHSIWFGYTYLDDQSLILESADILRRASPSEIFLNDVFFGAAKFYYRPLLTWSFVLDWHLGGGSIAFFHLTNLLYHSLSVCLAYALLLRTGIRRKVAFWLSLFFAIHPALVQAAIWIPGRNDVLAAAFIFLTLIFVSRWFREEKGRDLGLSWLFFLLALLTKETAALLPFLALGWILVYERRYFSWFKLGLASAGAAVSGFVWYLLRAAALDGGSSGGLLSSLADNLLSPVIFLGKALLPFNLSVYPVPADANWFFGIASILMLAALLAVSRPRNWRGVAYGFLWFWPLLVLGSARPDGEIYRNFMEHRLYIPIFGLMLILAETVRYWDRVGAEWRRRLIGAGLILFIFLSYQHSWHFRDRLVFWQQATESSPHSSLAQRNLGAMEYLDGNADDAEKRYLESLRLNPEEPMVHNNLAVIYMDRGDWRRAETELKEELKINPEYDVALFNLGRVYLEKRRFHDASLLFRETLRVNPRHPEAAAKLAEALEGMNEQ
ncbi:MAG: tetratricopeptide repeat protein [Bacillota bacterium]